MLLAGRSLQRDADNINQMGIFASQKKKNTSF